jgi:hypothetical protein
MVISSYFISAINTYSICGYQCFLVIILLIVIGDYAINGYW